MVREMLKVFNMLIQVYKRFSNVHKPVHNSRYFKGLWLIFTYITYIIGH